MIAGSVLNSVTAIVGMSATIAIIVTALGLILGMLKLADALKRIGTILGTVIALIVLTNILVNTWSHISAWQQLSLIAIGLMLLLRLGSRREKRHRSGD
ncbi:MAG: hypothetical protein ACLGSH_13940 [Acidobacteriota bacterium]